MSDHTAFEAWAKKNRKDLDLRYMHDAEGNYHHDGYIWADTANAFRLWLGGVESQAAQITALTAARDEAINALPQAIRSERAENEKLRAERDALAAALAASCEDGRAQLLEAGHGGGCSRAIEAEAKRDELLYFAKRCVEQLFPSVDDTRQTQRIAHDLRRHACTAISAAPPVTKLPGLPKRCKDCGLSLAPMLRLYCTKCVQQHLQD